MVDYKVGVIGLGVGEQHLRAFDALDNCDVVKICDFSTTKLAEVSGRFPGAKPCMDAIEILEDVHIDIVSIASFDQYHAEQVCTALDNQKHVFVEKPICLTRPELNAIHGRFKTSGKCLGSNFILRKAPRFQALKSMISSGEFGDIYHVRGSYDYGRIGKIQEGWRSVCPGYSVMHGGGIHLIDLICWLIDEQPAKVFAMGNGFFSSKSKTIGKDFISASIEFGSGIIGNISANFGSVTPHHHLLSVYGSKLTFEQSHTGAVYIKNRDPDRDLVHLSDDYPAVEKGQLIPDFVKNIVENPAKNSEFASQIFSEMSVSLAIEESLMCGQSVNVERYS